MRCRSLSLRWRYKEINLLDSGGSFKHLRNVLKECKKMDKATQRMKILNYCEKHGSITIREAFERLEINSPSKRISELRNSGEYNVKSVDESKTDENGNTTSWKRYFINELQAN